MNSNDPPPLQDALRRDGPPLLADGAMGTALQAAGLPSGVPAAGWTLERPAAVAAVHRAHVAAGSEVLLTNTLTANATHFEPGQVEALNRAAVALARTSGARWVAGSMGPGAGGTQARALAEAGVDLFWLETQLSVAQALDSVAACQRVGPLPIVVTFTFHRADGRTHAGERAADVARALAAAGVAAVGLNCGDGTHGIAARLTEMARACDLPLVLKPNAGPPHPIGDRWVHDGSPEAWADEVARGLTPRVRLVGGCCGTTTVHLRALRAALFGQEHKT